ncbi:MAG: DUF3990 domain-containing protein [Oscillospiraceae bacterium]|nr:DUF3990 domain-containing protein [Oscillospiraceae bacterium]
MTESDILHLFHTGYAEIREPDIHYGRKNADFGQGFYLSDSDEFAGKWMRERIQPHRAGVGISGLHRRAALGDPRHADCQGRLCPPADAHDACCAFFHTLRERRGRNFGNGREARHLRDAAIEELALRAMDDEAVNLELTAEDFSAAAKRLLEQEGKDEKETARIGF